MAWWRPVNAALGPLVEMFYPMPKSALIPVTVLWLGFGDGSKILLIFLGCMLPVTIGAFNGARGSDQALVWSARSMGASRMRMLWDVVVPSALPEMLNGIRTALALAFILLVSSELIVAREGLGYLIGYLGANGTYDAMFAVVLTVALPGLRRRPRLSGSRGKAAAMARVAGIDTKERPYGWLAVNAIGSGLDSAPSRSWRWRSVGRLCPQAAPSRPSSCRGSAPYSPASGPTPSPAILSSTPR